MNTLTPLLTRQLSRNRIWFTREDAEVRHRRALRALEDHAQHAAGAARERLFADAPAA